MSGMGSHTRVTPAGFKISTCVVTSNTRHLPVPSVFACVNRGSVDTTAIVGRAKLAFKNARLCTIILLIGQCQHSIGLLLTHSEMLCNTGVCQSRCLQHAVTRRECEALQRTNRECSRSAVPGDLACRSATARGSR